MPTPRRKQTRSKRGMRRSHDSLSTPAKGTCPECGEPKRPHFVCTSCGTYRGKEVIKTAEVEE